MSVDSDVRDLTTDVRQMKSTLRAIERLLDEIRDTLHGIEANTGT